MQAWRLIEDGRYESGRNMARDLELFEEVRRSGEGCLRLYNWDGPAITTGHHQKGFQPYDAGLNIPVYQRPTGGGAVLHIDDITYSVITPLEGSFASGITETYAAITGVFAAALQKCGLEVNLGEAGPGFSEVCFSRTAPVELKLGGLKLMGAAQLRRHGLLLQQGVLPLSVDHDLSARVFGPRLLLTGIRDVLPGFDIRIFIDYLCDGFSAAFDIRF